MADRADHPDAPETHGPAPAAMWVDRLTGALRAGNRDAAARHRLERALDAWLRDIDFEEVTLEDRIAFIEAVVAHRVRRAIARGRLDLVPHFCSAGIRKAGEVGAGIHAARSLAVVRPKHR